MKFFSLIDCRSQVPQDTPKHTTQAVCRTSPIKLVSISVF